MLDSSIDSSYPKRNRFDNVNHRRIQTRNKEDIDASSPFKPDESNCEPDINGLVGVPAAASDVVDIKFFYDLEVALEDKSFLAQRILPVIENSLTLDIVSIFLDSCQEFRTPLHHSSKMVAVDANPSKIVSAANCKQHSKADSVCNVIEASHSLYLDGVPRSQIAVIKRATLNIVEWRFRKGRFDRVDSSIVRAAWVGSKDHPAGNGGGVAKRMSRFILPSYVIGILGIAVFVVVIIALIATCGKRKKSTNEYEVKNGCSIIVDNGSKLSPAQTTTITTANNNGADASRQSRV